MERDQALRALTAAGAPFEVVDARADGGPRRAFRAGPQTLRELYQVTRSERPFLVFADDRLSFEVTWRRAAAVAQRLGQTYGVGRGDRVAIAMRNCPEWIIVFQAVTALGAIAVALNVNWSGSDLLFGLHDSGAKLLFTDERRALSLGGLSQLPPIVVVRAQTPVPQCVSYETTFGVAESDAPPDAVVRAGDNATILYTSGSTGLPKGVVSTHRNILTTLMSWELDAAAMALTMNPSPPAAFEPTALLAVPLFHVTGLHAAYLASLRAQRRLVMMPRWDAHEAAQLIERERVTHLTAPAAITGDLVAVAKAGGLDLVSLAAIGGGGAARAAGQVREIERVFANAVPLTGWGMTETNASGTSIHGEDYLERPESSGRASFMMDLRIVGDDGRVLSANERGELQVRGGSVMRDYWGRPDARAEAFDGEWFRTGDIAYLDEAGYLFIVDRIKDLVIRGGENIGCGLIESALLEHPAIMEAVVYGLPDERLGERVAATVRATDTVTGMELTAFLAERLARIQIPEAIRIVREPLPRTDSGKILRRQARDEALAALGEPDSTLV